MITHTVLFKWNAKASESDKAAVARALSGLRDTAPTVLELHCGSNFCDRSQGFEFGLVVRCADRAGLEAYAAHSEHLRVVEGLIKPICDEVIVVDFED